MQMRFYTANLVSCVVGRPCPKNFPGEVFGKIRTIEMVFNHPQDSTPKIVELVNITPISLGLIVDRYLFWINFITTAQFSLTGNRGFYTENHPLLWS